MQIKHIFFDNDGTLVDTEIIAIEIMLDLLRPCGFNMEVGEYSRRFPGLLERQILQIIENEYYVPIPADFSARLHEQQTQRFGQELPLIPGMGDLFRAVPVPKSMVSNATHRHVVRCLEQNDLSAWLDGLVFSAQDEGLPKPHPDIYLRALQTHDLRASEVLAVEDSPAGVQAAKAAGLRVVGFLGAAHIPEGHGAHLSSVGADFLAEDAAALRRVLELEFRMKLG